MQCRQSFRKKEHLVRHTQSHTKQNLSYAIIAPRRAVDGMLFAIYARPLILEFEYSLLRLLEIHLCSMREYMPLFDEVHE